MAVARLDAHVSWNTDDTSYAPSAGSNRGLIIAVTQEQGSSEDAVTVVAGGQSMTKAHTIYLAASIDLEAWIFLLLEAGIAAMSGSVIALTGQPTKFTVHGISYTGVNQTGGTTTVPEKNQDSVDASAPNPLTGSDIVAGDGSAVVAISASGLAATESWHVDMTGYTAQDGDPASHSGSLADAIVATGANKSVENTWSSQNRAVVCAIELAAAPVGGAEEFLGRQYPQGVMRGVMRGAA